MYDGSKVCHVVKTQKIEENETIKKIKDQLKPSRKYLKEPKSKKYLLLKISFIFYSFALFGQVTFSTYKVMNMIQLIKLNVTNSNHFDLPKDQVISLTKMQQVAPWVVVLSVPCIVASMIQILTALPILKRIIKAFVFFGISLGLRFILEVITLIVEPTYISLIPIIIDASAFPLIYSLLKMVTEENVETPKIKHIRLSKK